MKALRSLCFTISVFVLIPMAQQNIYAEDYFEIVKKSMWHPSPEIESIDHWVFKKGSDFFYSTGVNYLKPFDFQITRGRSWGEFAGGHGSLSAPAFWLSKQMHDLLYMNVNTLGYQCKLLDEYQNASASNNGCRSS